MPPLPDVTTSIQDKGLGILPPSAANAIAILGVCTAGTAATVYSFGDIATLQSTLTSGPAVEAAALALAQPNHGTVYVVPVNASVAGTLSSITLTRAPGTPSTGTCSTSGSPLDAYNVLLTITTGETTVAAGGGAFTYSLDGGTTTSAPQAIPTNGSFLIPGTGITVQFSGTVSPSWNVGDTIAFTSTAPYYSGTDLTNAWNALVANPNTWRCALIVGAASSATNAATLASTVASLLNTAEANFRYTYAIMQSNDTDANQITAFANFVSTRVMVCAGQEMLTSPLNGRVLARDSSWVVASRIVTRPVSEDPGRTATGSLVGITKLLRDENATPALDAQRFTTLRTIVGLQGFYITEGLIMASVGSDYSLVQNRQVMDVACTIARVAMLQFLNSTVRVNPATAQTNPGGINELDARRIENYVGAQIQAAIVAPGDASSVSVVVNRTTNVLSTRTIPITVRIVPDGYGKYITNNIGFTNPALVLH